MVGPKLGNGWSCWQNVIVGVLGHMMAQHILANCNRVIYLNIRVIFIVQKLYKLFLIKNSVILFYKNNFHIFLVILSDFDNLKLSKARFFVKLLWMFLLLKPLITHRKLIVYN